ncbi:Rhodanese-like domain-containing protein-like protein [Hapsidospora chrysogenum ATCC 11550]|uniref:Rhodanese-like domain-containing protein-like protein n=1 Tax=Hapsidospora chrysogenum (strain ATCC 11550 / CBS 779.69 / DSM 880 / IAM 14645 / JCM 23072 / IMI 49137) TaxID=857340 RepID=A0A086TGU1_HAPC1|nr:Rhodanese-like domain-containing protein-like protein [Hapsidospora chrysogenum ATCC 11550]
MFTTDEDNASLPLPRILCLHGGGTSANIFKLQCRGIIKRLGSTFRFVFVDGPWRSQPHPAIVPFFGDEGPFYRWMRWDGEHEQDEDAENKVLSTCLRAMDEDRGTGPWVGILGFSQGAKIAASILWAQEKIHGGEGPFRFGVIMAGRAPIVRLDPEGKVGAVPYTADISQMSSDVTDWAQDNRGEHAISIPTLHVHGTQDPAMDLHQLMSRNYCKDGTATVIEWEGGHRLPIRTDDVEAVAKRMLQLARETGAIAGEGW